MALSLCILSLCLLLLCPVGLKLYYLNTYAQADQIIQVGMSKEAIHQEIHRMPYVHFEEFDDGPVECARFEIVYVSNEPLGLGAVARALCYNSENRLIEKWNWES